MFLWPVAAPPSTKILYRVIYWALDESKIAIILANSSGFALYPELLINFKNIHEGIDVKRKEISSKIINLNNRQNNAREKYLEDQLGCDDY